MIGNITEVGEVCGRSEAISLDGLAAMQHIDGLEACTEQVDAPVQLFHMHLGQGGVVRIALKDVAKNILDLARS